jgi:hypothetical protein
MTSPLPVFGTVSIPPRCTSVVRGVHAPASPISSPLGTSGVSGYEVPFVAAPGTGSSPSMRGAPSTKKVCLWEIKRLILSRSYLIFD